MFPTVEYADPDGLLAAGGDLSVDTLLEAYRSGIFPWYSEGEPILWWSPDPRFVILPGKLAVSSSMRKVLTRQTFDIRFNTAFEQVITECGKIKRRGQRGTWITNDVKQAYIELHRRGFALCGEAWRGNKLVGGFYGVQLGQCFFGESMFSRETNASKAAFLTFAGQFFKAGGKLIDCQVYTEHLESLGAEMLPRAEFIKIVKANVGMMR